MRHQMHSAAFQAWAYIIKGDVAHSLSSLERAQQLAKSAELAQLTGYAANVPPIINFLLGDWEKSEPGFGTTRRGGDPSTPPGQWLGRLYIQQGNIIAARAHLQESLDMDEARGGEPGELVPHALLAEVAAMEGKMEDAKAHFPFHRSNINSMS